jgi:hypothetical protein
MTRTALILAAALVAASCGDDSPTAASSTTPTSSTEYFTGSLSPRTSQFYSFSVNTAGAVAVTLASVTSARIGPAGTATLSLGLGTPSGFGCSTTSSGNATPGLNAQLTTASSAAGIYCVSVADPGALAGDVLFVIRIVHT